MGTTVAVGASPVPAMRAVLVAWVVALASVLRSRASLHLEVLALRHPLAVLHNGGRAGVAGLFTVATVRFRVLSVLILLAHDRRKGRALQYHGAPDGAVDGPAGHRSIPLGHGTEVSAARPRWRLRRLLGPLPQLALSPVPGDGPP